MKTIELLGSSDVVALITRVPNSQAYTMVADGKAKYVPKSKWKTIRDAKNKEIKFVAAVVKPKPEQKDRDRKHFKKGRRNEQKHTSNRQASADNSGQQRVQGQDRKAG